MSIIYIYKYSPNISYANAILVKRDTWAIHRENPNYKRHAERRQHNSEGVMGHVYAQKYLLLHYSSISIESFILWLYKTLNNICSDAHYIFINTGSDVYHCYLKTHTIYFFRVLTVF